MKFTLDVMRCERGTDWQHSAKCGWLVYLRWEEEGEPKVWSHSGFDLATALAKAGEVAKQTVDTDL